MVTFHGRKRRKDRPIRYRIDKRHGRARSHKSDYVNHRRRFIDCDPIQFAIESLLYVTRNWIGNWIENNYDIPSGVDIGPRDVFNRDQTQRDDGRGLNKAVIATVASCVNPLSSIGNNELIDYFAAPRSRINYADDLLGRASRPMKTRFVAR